MPDIEILLTPGLRELTGKAASSEDIATTLRPLDRGDVIRTAIRVLNSLALDRRTGYQDDQGTFVSTLSPRLQAQFRAIARTAGTRVMLVHPAQQLALIHAAARYAMPTGGRRLGDPLARAEWGLACLQINDHLMKTATLETGARSWDKALYLFSEDALRWELVNPSRPEKSLARLRALLTQLPASEPVYAKAAEHLRKAFSEHLGMDFETAFNLTAFLIFHWTAESANMPNNPDAALINLETWLQRSAISRETLERYLQAVSLRIEDIPGAFPDGMSFRDVLPFRRKPLLRLDEDGVAFLCPQFVSEKSWVDLFWLLTKPRGHGPEARMWTEDFGLLYEAYVRSVLEDLGPKRLGGNYAPDITYTYKGEDGQIDGLIHAGNTLGIIEAKGSLIRQTLLAHGSLAEIRDDLTKKFIQDGDARKGVSQLVHAIHWLADQRRNNRPVAGFDLKSVERIVPIIIVADRHLRYPRLGTWFNFQFTERLKAVWAQVGSLVICGTEDLENLEHIARLGGGTPVMESLTRYSSRVRHGEYPLHSVYESPRGPHPRLDPLLGLWFKELQDQHILPA